MSRSIRRLLIASVIAYHAAVLLCGPCLHELPGLSHRIGPASKHHASESLAGARGESTDLCPICLFVAQGQLPAEFRHDASEQVLAALAITAPHARQPLCLPPSANPRAPPVRSRARFDRRHAARADRPRKRPPSSAQVTQILGPCGLEDGLRTINNPEAHVEDYWSMHRGGVNLIFADALVHFLKSSINPIPYRAPATRNFGEAISADSY